MMGRKQKPLVSENFSRGDKLANNSNRYAHTCNHCGQNFPKGRLETLEAHLRRCPSLSHDERDRTFSLMMNSTDMLSQQQHVYPIGVTESHNHQALLALADVSEAQLQSVGSHHQSGFQYANDTSNSLERYGMEDLYTATNLPIFTDTSVTGVQGQADYQYSELPSDHDSSIGLHFTDQANASCYSAVSVPPFSTYPTSFQPLPERLSATQNDRDVASRDITPGQQPIPSETTISRPVSLLADSGQADAHDRSHNNPFDLNYDVNLAEQQSDLTRRRKRAYSPETNQKVRKVREAGACIRCGRLNRVCSEVKPCRECSERKGDKTWTGGCMKFNKGDDFDEWYKSRLVQVVESELGRLQAQNVVTDDGFSIKFTLFDNIPQTQIKVSSYTISHESINGPTGKRTDFDPTTEWTVMSIDKLEGVVLSYVRVNIRALLNTVDQQPIRSVLDAAWTCTQGQKPAEKIQIIKGMNSTGDNHMARLIEIWLAVYLLSSTQSTWKFELYDENGNRSFHNTTHQNFQSVRKQVNACIEQIIKQSQKDSIVHKLNITRITQKSNKDLYNLLLGILIILNAIERYCLWHHRLNLANQTEQQTPTSNLIAKAERLLSIYLYAIRGTSMIPPLSISLSVSDSVSVAPQDPDSTTAHTTAAVTSHRIITTPPVDHTVPRDKKDYRVNYSMISPFINDLHLEENDLRRRRASVQHQDISDNDISTRADGTEWDGWLWSGVFLMMLDR